jgi:hypothetical protein
MLFIGFAVLRFRVFPVYCATPCHVAVPVKPILAYHIVRAVGECPAVLLNIAKRSLPGLTLRGVGFASKDAVVGVFRGMCFQSST